MIVSSRAMLICLLATICLLKPVVSKPYYADEDDETNEVDFEEDSKQGFRGATDSKYFDEDDESEDDERFKEADENEDKDEDYAFKDEDISKKEIDEESIEEDEEENNSEEGEYVDFNPKEEKKRGYFSYMYHKAKDFLKSLGK